MTISRRVPVVSVSVALLALAGLVLWSTDSTDQDCAVDAPGQFRPVGELPALRGASTAGGELPPAPQSFVRVVVRDLADVSAVPGVDLVQRAGTREPLYLKTDHDGGLDAPGRPELDRGTFTIGSDGWHLANNKPELHCADQVLWVWRSVLVRGRIEYASRRRPSELSHGNVHVEARYGGPSVDAGRRRPAPWRDQGSAAHGFGITAAPKGVRADGTYHLTIPRMDGIGLCAQAQGLETAYEMLAVDATTDVVDVVLRLRPCLRVHGGARNEDGKPIANAEVRAYVVRRQDAATVAFSRLRVEFEEAYTASIPSGSTRGWVTTVQTARTDADGRFTLPLRTRGEVGLVAYVTQDVRDVAVMLPRSPEPPTVRLTYGGRAIAGGRFVVADMTARELQAGHVLRTNQAGDAAPTWLRRGRRYLLAHDTCSGGGRFPRPTTSSGPGSALSIWRAPYGALKEWRSDDRSERMTRIV